MDYETIYAVGVVVVWLVVYIGAFLVSDDEPVETVFPALVLASLAAVFWPLIVPVLLLLGVLALLGVGARKIYRRIRFEI